MKIESAAWRRLAWMVGIWMASVAALGLISLLLKWWLGG